MTAAGIPLMGGFTLPPASVLWFTLCAFLMTASLCAVFTMAALLNQNSQIQVGAGVAHGDLVADGSVAVLRADEKAAKGGEDHAGLK